ncbi:MAG: universal stress protein [Desulfomonilaceae bacterium]
MIPKKILFCTDFSENSIPARNYAIGLAKAFNSSLAILHVVNSSRLGYPAFEAGVPFDIQSMLLNIEQSVNDAFSKFLSEFQGQLTEVTTTYKVGSPVAEIVRFAEENGVDLTVMGTHGWTGFNRLILGSTAENVIRIVNCPVLTVKSRDGN